MCELQQHVARMRPEAAGRCEARRGCCARGRQCARGHVAHRGEVSGVGRVVDGESAARDSAGRHHGRAAGLPDGPGPGRAWRWWRTAADQDTAMASSIAAALLSYYTIAQVDGLLANKLGVTEAASALQIAVRFPDDGGADEVVAAIGEQILAPTDVSLSNWTVRPSSGCSGPGHAHRGSERGRLQPVEHTT